MKIEVRRMNGKEDKIVAYNDDTKIMDNITKVVYKWLLVDGKIKYQPSCYSDQHDNNHIPSTTLLSYDEMIDITNEILLIRVYDVLNEILDKSYTTNLAEKYYMINFGPDRQYEFGYTLRPEDNNPFRVYGTKLNYRIRSDGDWTIDEQKTIYESTDDISKVEEIISKMVKDFVDVLCNVYLGEAVKIGGDHE